MSDRRRERLRGMAALGGLLLIAVGVPVALDDLGAGLPTRLPSGHGVVNAFGQHLSDSVLLRGASLACWCVWALFIAAVVLEVLACIGPIRRGRASGVSGRTLRVPGLQGMARTLVISAALLLPNRPALAGPAIGRPRASAPVEAGTGRGAGHPAVISADHQPDSGRLLATSVAKVTGRPEVEDDAMGATIRPPSVGSPERSGVAPTRPAPSPTGVPDGGAPATGGSVRYVVQRYDSPWRIAERLLGDGTRWRDLLDEHGRSLADGGPQSATHSRHQRDGARIIYAGEVQIVPTHGLPDAPARPLPPPALAARATAIPAAP
ncbi:MAG TPA: hypothetical protein VKQ71_00400, partial [Acidimicrobiales bacterium]|nr:hypothetical protein [Acidimicrobiales bacterium]